MAQIPVAMTLTLKRGVTKCLRRPEGSALWTPGSFEKLHQTFYYIVFVIILAVYHNLSKNFDPTFSKVGEGVWGMKSPEFELITGI
ncbi:MAG: hypothetical protein V3S29_03220 [bacterium]